MDAKTISPRISFGIIVLNGEPFVKYTLRALYPHAYEIIVVEGAVEGARKIATSDGHSLDDTLSTIQQFKAQEDPENKLRIITKDGFWSEKDEMSQAYANVATGDYLWQVDVDEFYKDEDIVQVKNLLQENPEITAISFKMLTFWGSPDYLVDGWYLQRGANIYHRLFKWGDGYQYVTHRPPTVVNEHGQDLRSLNWINGHQLQKEYGVQMFHYSLLFPKQVTEKSAYYDNAQWAKRNKALLWDEEAYQKLNWRFHVHNVYQYPSWLEEYRGSHPLQVTEMWQQVSATTSEFNLRPMEDVAELLSMKWYQIARFVIKYADHFVRLYKQAKSAIIKTVKKLIGQPLRKTSATK